MKMCKGSRANIMKAFQGLNSVNVNIYCKAEVGSDFGELIGATKDAGVAQSTVAHEKNEVMLINFWGSWCKNCHVPITAVQEMMAANSKKWEGKVRAVALSID